MIQSFELGEIYPWLSTAVIWPRVRLICLLYGDDKLCTGKSRLMGDRNICLRNRKTTLIDKFINTIKLQIQTRLICKNIQFFYGTGHDTKLYIDCKRQRVVPSPSPHSVEIGPLSTYIYYYRHFCIEPSSIQSFCCRSIAFNTSLCRAK